MRQQADTRVPPCQNTRFQQLRSRRLHFILASEANRRTARKIDADCARFAHWTP